MAVRAAELFYEMTSIMNQASSEAETTCKSCQSTCCMMRRAAMVFLTRERKKPQLRFRVTNAPANHFAFPNYPSRVTELL